MRVFGVVDKPDVAPPYEEPRIFDLPPNVGKAVEPHKGRETGFVCTVDKISDFSVKVRHELGSILPPHMGAGDSRKVGRLEPVPAARLETGSKATP
jgi:hypothetical protein